MPRALGLIPPMPRATMGSTQRLTPSSTSCRLMPPCTPPPRVRARLLVAMTRCVCWVAQPPPRVATITVALTVVLG